MGWVILSQGDHGLLEAAAVVPLPEKVQNGFPIGVIHDAVQFPIHKVAAAQVICDFVGCVFPDLPDEQGVWLDLPDAPL